VRCHNCHKLGHFAKVCWKGVGAKNKPKNQKSEAHAKDDILDSEVIILMARTSENVSENAL